MKDTSTPPNRSMPSSSIVPVLGYRDVRAAAEWLCRAFGFNERLRIGEHRAQLVLDDAAIVASALPAGAASTTDSNHSMMMRVADVDRHHEHARRCGARIVVAPADHPYGERQYSAQDIGGHLWTFSQTIADVDPADWGGQLFEECIDAAAHRPA
ncbi:MAG: VOC family protein [Dokdonella sp.]